MTSDHESESSRLNEILAEFLQRVEAGESVDREALLGQHPEFAEELQEFLADDSQWKRVARADDSETSPTMDVTPRDLREAEIAPTFDSDAPSGSAEVAPQRVGYFGDYELLEEIARGGMGVVYKARQVNLDRTVALKMILSGQLASEDDVRRFYQEAEAAANLDHRNIVPIFEVGEHEGQHFFSMGYIDGPSLAQLLSDGPLPPEEAAQVVRQVAEAIAYAHSRGVIHRDLKPANVLLSGGDTLPACQDDADTTSKAARRHDYVPKVTDFGLAKRTEGESELTGTGQILGTPSYMPPEQASGQSKAIGPAADVYSLGAILYSALTGHPPFQAANPMDTLMQVLQKEPPPPRQINAAVPLDLETICLKCLEKDQFKRYAAAQELADELQRYLDGKPILARPVGRVERTWRWCRRHPLAAGAIAAIDVLLIAIVVLIWYSYHSSQESLAEITHQKEQVTRQKSRAERGELAAQKAQAKAEREAANAVTAREKAELEKNKAELARQDAVREKAAAEAARRDADEARKAAEAREKAMRLNLYHAQYHLARREWENNNIPRALELLDSAPEEHRHFEWGHLKRLCRGGLQTLPGSQWPITAICVSDDGSRVASLEEHEGGRVRVWDTMTGKQICDIKSVWSKAQIGFSSDGKLIAGPYGETVQVWDAATGEKRLSLTGHTDQVRSVCFTPDGQRIVSASKDETIKIWNVMTGDLVRTIEGNKGWASYVSVTADGRRIVSDGYGSVNVWDAETGEPLAKLEGLDGMPRIAVSADGRRVVTLVYGDIQVWDVASGEQEAALSYPYSPAICLRLSPDGQRVYFGSADHSIRVWEIKTGTIEALRGHRKPVTAIALTADGKRLISGTGRIERSKRGKGNYQIKVWDAAGGEESLTLEGHSRGELDVDIAPDGKRIVSGSSDTTVRVWDAETGSELKAFDTEAMIRSVAFSPDGTKIVAGGRFPKRFTIWDLSEDKQPREFGGGGSTVGSIRFTPDGQRLVTIENGPKVREFETGEELFAFKEDGKQQMGALCLDISADGKRIVTGGGIPPYLKNYLKNNPRAPKNIVPGINVWDATTGKLLKAIPCHKEMVTSVCISADGKQVFSGSWDETIKVWDADSGQELLTLQGHSGPVFSLSLSADERRLVSGSCLQNPETKQVLPRSNSIKVWDTQNGRELCSLVGHIFPVTSICFSTDGRRIVSASEAGVIKVWNSADQD